MKTALITIIVAISFCASTYGLSCYSCWGSSCERSNNNQPIIKECTNQTNSVVYSECIAATISVAGSETKMKGCVPYVWVPFTDSISCDFIKSMFEGVKNCYTCTSDRCNVDDFGNSV
ncbi:hypothetical protein ACFFRR_000702 [Megaselia abdita]